MASASATAATSCKYLAASSCSAALAALFCSILRKPKAAVSWSVVTARTMSTAMFAGGCLAFLATRRPPGCRIPRDENDASSAFTIPEASTGYQSQSAARRPPEKRT
eukprot:scaffold130670_cov57-Phaeocystis_antarctica.AAC.2